MNKMNKINKIKMNNIPRKFFHFFIALKLSTCGDTNFIQYGKFSFCLIHSDRFLSQNGKGDIGRRVIIVISGGVAAGRQLAVKW